MKVEEVLWLSETGLGQQNWLYEVIHAMTIKPNVDFQRLKTAIQQAHCIIS